MDIKNDFFHWVKRVKPSSREGVVELWGSAIAEEYELGSGGKERHLQGEFAGISPTTAWQEKDVALGFAHTTRGGFYWSLQAETSAQLPETPFLITNNLGLKIIFDGSVRIHPELVWADIEEDDGWALEWSLCCDDWFGMLLMEPGEFKTQGRFIAFSDLPEAKVTATQTLFLGHNLEQVFGTVEPLG